MLSWTKFNQRERRAQQVPARISLHKVHSTIQMYTTGLYLSSKYEQYVSHCTEY